jgi:hypothetical protein
MDEKKIQLRLVQMMDVQGGYGLGNQWPSLDQLLGRNLMFKGLRATM